MGLKLKQLSRLVFLVIFMQLPISGSAQIRKALLDISDSVRFSEGSFKLSGEWEFYWDTLLTSEGLQKKDAPGPDLYIDVPSYWTGQVLNDKKLLSGGCATYRLQVVLPRSYRDPLAMDVPVFDDAFRLYVDGKYIGGNGTVGPTENEAEPGYEPFITFVEPVSDTMEIILQVSNFEHRRGGFWKPLVVGTPDAVLKNWNRYEFISYLSLGVLFGFVLLFLFFFLFFRQDKILLFFSLMLFGVFLRLLSTDLYPINLVADLPWKWIIKMEYGGSFLAFLFGAWYFYSFYPARFLLRITQVHTLVSVIALALILLSPVKWFSYTMFYFQPAILLFLLYYLGRSLIGAYRGSRNDAIYFAGLMLLILAVINDIRLANSQSALTRDYIVHFVIQVFVFIQGIMLIRKWVQAYRENEALNQEIQFVNKNLEQLIRQRTEELDLRNERVKEQNEQIASQNELLQKELALKNRVFSIIAHDLRSPVVGLVQFSDLLISKYGDPEVLPYLYSMSGLSRSAAEMLDNLLFWGRSQGNQLQYDPGDHELVDIVERVGFMSNELAKPKSIKLEFSVSPEWTVHCDRTLIEMVLRNLLSNAIKFSDRGSRVVLSAEKHEQKDNLVRIRVRDQGTGMKQEVIEGIFSDREITSTPGTNQEKGTGLGLKLCYELVKMHQGEFKLHSEPGKGTEVSFTLPLIS